MAAGTEVVGTGIIAFVVAVLATTTWHQWVRLRRELRARGGCAVCTPGRIVGARTVVTDGAYRTTYYRIRFLTTDGRTVEVERELPLRGALAGAVTVTYHPDQPEHAAVRGRSDRAGWLSQVAVVAVMTPVTLSTAGGLTMMLAR